MVYTVGKTRKKGVSPRTLSAYFSAISSYYDYLIYEGTLNKNPIPPFRKRYLADLDLDKETIIIKPKVQ